MGYDLQDFVRDIEARGELKRVSARVSPVLEISEIYDRVVKKAGPALLFENVEGSDLPVLINAFGTWDRMVLALGREPSLIGQDLMALVKTKPPKGLRELWALARKAREVLSFPPKRVSRGACQEVVLTGNEIDLTRIPILQSWPLDAGRFVTLPLVFTRDPESNERNVGMYRMQALDRNTTAMHWQTHKHGAEHFRKAKKLGVKLPVAVALGGDPAMTYGATAPLPPGLDEVMFAGYIRGKRQRMVMCKTQPLDVPANAEIILEGYVDPSEPLVTEGPFGDHTGYYSLAGLYPKFHVTAITRKRNAIYPTTVVGVPPQEDGPMGRATERLFLELARFQIPELVDWSMPYEGAFHNLMLVSIKKRYPGHARKAMMSLWGAGMLSLEKAVLVFDEDVNLTDPAQVFGALARLDVARDVLIVDQVPTDTLDHAAPVEDLGSHVGIDLTTPLPTEPRRRAPPAAARATKLEGVVASRYFHERLLFVTIRKQKAWQARATMESIWRAGESDGTVIVVFDDDVDLHNDSDTLFHATANLDPARDITVQGARMGIDATVKREDENARAWPPIIRMDEATRRLVDKRWSDYGL